MNYDEVPNPFPGLRPFEFGDNHLFFGRDQQTTELTTRLRKNRFVAVVGTSGSGKSSLVRAGLMPELLSGTMAGAGSSWETTIMRPGGDPLTNLANAIVDADLYDPEEEDIASQVRATLTRSGLGLVEAMRQSELPEGTNFLLVVDQFEEIFRFRRSDDATDEQAAFFVNLLLEASAQADLPLYVIITMRSDFLGECSQFPRLADTVNEGEFLIPRLNRDQRKEAIVGPVKVAGGEITDRLLLRLLNDIGDDPDQLPILQHALMRTWDLFKERGGDGALDLEHYQATGGMSEALSRHADEVYGELPDDEHKRIAEKLFKSLTEKVDANRGIRRPMQLAELHEICGGEESHLREVLDAFRKTGCTFLMPAGEVKIKIKTVIDISHESLMRAWRSLRNWVDEEAQSAKIYRRLADTATLYHEDKAGLYRDPDLQISLSWREENRPNRTWADRYYPGFDSAMAFLDQSQEEAERVEREREEARQREVDQANALAKVRVRSAKIFKYACIGISILAMVAIISMLDAKKNEAQAIVNRELAEKFLYVSDINLANKAIVESNYGKAKSLLTKYRKSESGSNWELEYLWGQCKNDYEKKLELNFNRSGHIEQTKDGNIVAISNYHPTQRGPAKKRIIKLFKPSNLELIDDIIIEESSGAYTFSKNSKQIAYTIKNGFIVKDLSTMDSVEEFNINGRIIDLLFIKEDKCILVSTSEGTFIIDKSSGKTISNIPYSVSGYVGKPTSYSEELKLIAFSSEKNIVIWDFGNNKLKKLIPIDIFANSLRFSNDSRKLYASIRNPYWDGELKMWDTENWDLLSSISGHLAWISYIHENEKGEILTCSADQTIKIWTEDLSLKHTLIGHTSEIWGMAFNKHSLITGTKFGEFLIWDPNNISRENINPSIKLNIDSVQNDIDTSTARSFSLLKKNIFWADATGRVYRKTEKDQTSFDAHDDRIQYIKNNDNCSLLVTIDRKGVQKFWDLNEKSKLLTERKKSRGDRIYLSDNKEFYLSINGDRIESIDFNSGEMWSSVADSKHNFIFTAVFSPDGKQFATCGDNATIKLWSYPEIKQLNEFSGQLLAIFSIAFINHGKTIIGGSGDGAIIFWDVETSKELMSINADRGSIYDLQYDHENRTLVSFSPKGLQYWGNFTE